MVVWGAGLGGHLACTRRPNETCRSVQGGLGAPWLWLCTWAIAMPVHMTRALRDVGGWSAGGAA